MNRPQVFQYEDEGGVIVVTILRHFSEFSEESVGDESAEIVAAIREGAIQKVVVDFSHVPVFGSSVLEMLVKLRRTAGSAQAKVAVCHLSPAGREVMRISRLEKVFSICDTRDEAMELVNA